MICYIILHNLLRTGTSTCTWRTAPVAAGAEDHTTEITKIQVRWKMSLKVHWEIQLRIHDDV